MGLLDSVFNPVKKKVEKKLADKVALADARDPTAEESQQAMQSATANNQVATWDRKTNTFTYRPMTPDELAQNTIQQRQNQEATAPAQQPGVFDGGSPTNELLNRALDQFRTPITNPALNKGAQVDRVAQALGQRAVPQGNAFNFARPGAGSVAERAPQASGYLKGFNGDSAGAQQAKDLLQQASDKISSGVTPGTPGSEAPVVNRQKIDEILGGLSGYQNKIADLAEDNTGLSVAEAQLKKATDLANIQAGIDTEASQRAALGAARSTRNRGDRALAERQAIGESSFIGQEAARTAALRRAQNEGDMAQLRAQEADYDRRFRLDALSKAADLGLNRSALEADISKVNLDSATNWINQQFNQLGIDKQLNSEQAKALLGFTRDMAAIEQQYDQMSQQDQQFTDSLVMQKYGIDEQTAMAMKQMKEAGKFHWGAALQGFIGGAGSAATGAGAKALGIG